MSFRFIKYQTVHKYKKMYPPCKINKKRLWEVVYFFLSMWGWVSFYWCGSKVVFIDARPMGQIIDRVIEKKKKTKIRPSEKINYRSLKLIKYLLLLHLEVFLSKYLLLCLYTYILDLIHRYI